VLAASRVLVGVSAQSIAAVEDSLTVVQFRALVIVASRGPIHLSALADAMRVHPSNATRTCDRLVADGLLDRRENPHDRRHLALTLTAPGRRILDAVMDRRRAAITDILRRMPADDRHHLAEVLTQFATAGGEPSDHHLWSLGWTTDGPAALPAPGAAPGARPAAGVARQNQGAQLHGSQCSPDICNTDLGAHTVDRSDGPERPQRPGTHQLVRVFRQFSARLAGGSGNGEDQPGGLVPSDSGCRGPHRRNAGQAVTHHDDQPSTDRSGSRPLRMVSRR